MLTSKMRVLIISDVLRISNNELNRMDITITNWESKLPSIETDYHAIVIDMSGMEIDRLRIIKDNIKVVSQCLTSDILNNNNLIVVAVCGAQNHEFIDYIYGDEYESTGTSITTKLYDCFQSLIPEYTIRIKEVVSGGSNYFPLSIKYPSVLQYLDIIGKYYIVFQYDDTKSCENIYPLSMVRKRTNACLAFEHRLGKGIFVLLPGYDPGRQSDAYLSLIRICRNYL